MRKPFFLLVATMLGCGAPVEDPSAEVEAETAGTWTSLGHGVAYREMPDATGERAFVVYGGYTAQLAWVEAWAQALHRARLKELGVRHLYAVQGPRDAGYGGREIANSKLALHLVARVRGRTEPIGVAAHSSGSFVAHELFGQLANPTFDPTGATSGRIVYFDLEGGGSGLGKGLVARLSRAYFVSARDASIGTSAHNVSAAKSLASTWAPTGVYVEVAAASGCNVGAGWCLHDAVVTTRPHNRATYDLARDYTDFAPPRTVVTAWLDASPELR